MIELSKEAKAQAVASIQRYVNDNEIQAPIGNIAAMGLLSYFLEEIAPSVYNQAVADVQERLLQRVQEVDLEVHEDEFAHSRRLKDGAAKPGRR